MNNNYGPIRKLIREMIDDEEDERSQEEIDLSHINDVEERLREGEIRIKGKLLTPEEAEQYVMKNLKDIVRLGREGYNPFDTVYIIQKNKKSEEGDLNERGLAFNEKTLTPRSDGSDLPHHAPVTTNKPHPNRKSRFK